MRRVVLFITMFVTLAANAATPKYSTFEVKAIVTISGTAVDMTGAIIVGVELEIKCGVKAFRATTDVNGKYDFGEIGPGKCRVAALNPTWNPPRMRCDARHCHLKPMEPTGEVIE